MTRSFIAGLPDVHRAAVPPILPFAGALSGSLRLGSNAWIGAPAGAAWLTAVFRTKTDGSGR